MLKAHCSKVHGNSTIAGNKAAAAAATTSSASTSSTYECKVCSLKFISFSGLARHQKMKHGIRGGTTNSSGNGNNNSSGSNGAGDNNNHPSSRVPTVVGMASPSVEIDVSSTSTPVTLDVKDFAADCSEALGDDAVAAGDATLSTSGNKSLSEEDFLNSLTMPTPMDDTADAGGGGGGAGGGDSFKCGNCFLFFDDSVEFEQHGANCG